MNSGLSTDRYLMADPVITKYYQLGSRPVAMRVDDGQSENVQQDSRRRFSSTVTCRPENRNPRLTTWGWIFGLLFGSLEAEHHMGKKRTDRLIGKFASAAKRHHRATMKGHWRETNRQAKRIARIFAEIRAIGESARRELLDLVDSDDPAIASMAATYSLKFDTERSRTALQRIAKEPGILGFVAEQAIQRWDEGEWQLE